MDKVFFHIVVYNYNGMSTIKNCLDGILSLMTTSNIDYDITIIDDYSKDYSDKLCEMYERMYSCKIRYILTESFKGKDTVLKEYKDKKYEDLEFLVFLDSKEKLFENKLTLNVFYKLLENNDNINEHIINKLQLLILLSLIINKLEIKNNNITLQSFLQVEKIKKYCVYTCITGGYDTLHQILKIDKNVDYICFTDNANIKSNNWKIRPIPEELKYLSAVKLQRIIKICPHRYLKEYDISIWIDGNFIVKNVITPFIHQHLSNTTFFKVRKHPCRNCIYDEAIACVLKNKDTYKNILSMLNFYKSIGYPKNFGLAETNILLRRHNDLRCIFLAEEWAKQLLKYSHRDLLSFNYAVWKTGIMPEYFSKLFRIYNNNGLYFNWDVKHGKCLR